MWENMEQKNLVFGHFSRSAKPIKTTNIESNNSNKYWALNKCCPLTSTTLFHIQIKINVVL